MVVVLVIPIPVMSMRAVGTERGVFVTLPMLAAFDAAIFIEGDRRGLLRFRLSMEIGMSNPVFACGPPFGLERRAKGIWAPDSGRDRCWRRIGHLPTMCAAHLGSRFSPHCGRLRCCALFLPLFPFCRLGLSVLLPGWCARSQHEERAKQDSDNRFHTDGLMDDRAVSFSWKGNSSLGFHEKTDINPVRRLWRNEAGNMASAAVHSRFQENCLGYET